jgi:hypothetical protein
MAQEKQSMTDQTSAAHHLQHDPLLTLLELGQQARQATSLDELAFLLCNTSHTLLPYRQAVLWLGDDGPRALSGVSRIEHNTPYLDWLKRMLAQSWPSEPGVHTLNAQQLPETARQAWSEWWPACAISLPLDVAPGSRLLLARDVTFSEEEQGLLMAWLHVWQHAWRALAKQEKQGVKQRLQDWRKFWQSQSQRPWHRRPRVWLAGLLVTFVFAPVRMTVLASGELVPAQPVVVRAPIEGVIARFHVQPNQNVKTGQLLFEFDEALLQSRVEVAFQSLQTAQAQFRQTSQLALDDAKYKAELAAVAGAIQERHSEYNFLKSQLQRGAVVANGTGMALFDDPLTWVGKPVTVGEQIMRIARADDVEVQAWLPLDDVVNLPTGSTLTLYLQSNPLSPVHAEVSYLSHEAVLRPDGTYAYRVRARPFQGTDHSVGQKGTAKISGEWTFLSYWLLRKPLALLRTTLGI